MGLVSLNDSGLFCKQGNFYIDPWSPVDYAVITHAHSDHARPGSKNYLCHALTKPLLELRLGQNNYVVLQWNEKMYINGVQLSLHPAGHIIGSSQIRIEYKGEVCVISGDYKTTDDGISGAFEPIKCNTFITESTFGLPIYKWKEQKKIYSDITEWVKKNQADQTTSILIGYSLGKAQRLLSLLAPLTNSMYVHGAIYNVHQALINAGISLPNVIRITPQTTKEELKASIVIAPPSADQSPWLKRFNDYKVGICSGWMQVRGNARRSNADIGFALSDHADWDGLLSAIKATEATKIYITHGFQSVLSRYLQEINIDAEELKTAFGNEEEQNEINDTLSS